MRLPLQAIIEFKALYLQKYGVELTDAQVREEATTLLNLYSLSQKENISYE